MNFPTPNVSLMAPYNTHGNAVLLLAFFAALEPAFMK